MKRKKRSGRVRSTGQQGRPSIGSHGDQKCDECSFYGPALLLTPLWVSDGVGTWDTWVCPECMIRFHADPDMLVEDPWPMDVVNGVSTLGAALAGELHLFPKSGRDRAANSAPSGHTPESAGGDRDWSQGS